MEDEFELINEVILPKRVVQNTVEPIAKGGDCVFCCLAGIMDCSISEAYLRCDNTEFKPASWSCLSSYLHVLHRKGYIDRFITDVPFWLCDLYDGHMTWGITSTNMSLAWFHYVQMSIDAGYYGLVSVNHKKEGYPSHADHKQLVCGVRTRIKWGQLPEGSKFGQHLNELLISDSSSSLPDEEWVEVNDFLKQRGGYNIQLVRPKL